MGHFLLKFTINVVEINMSAKEGKGGMGGIPPLLTL
jgi:hypothetical protein